MLSINKTASCSPIDLAAEELKKYLRMMMPEGGDIKIAYAPEAKDGFRLGLLSDFGLEADEEYSPELDDVVHIDCDIRGGIIAGANPRAVLIATYEYLRQNGCRWLYPGVDGEYIPMQSIRPVKYRHKPSMRYRGQATEGYISMQHLIDAIDFMPKIGLNAFMVEFMLPVGYFRKHYMHLHNTENRPAQSISNDQILRFKRCAEAELSRRGIQFHDVGHGFTCEPFGISSAFRPADGDASSLISERQAEYLAMVDGARGFRNNFPIFTNFCMSNAEAREAVCDYVCRYARGHSNADILHVWLADGRNNHCECEGCSRSTPSDLYILLLNEIDERLTAEGLSTRIAFISYTDTTFAPKRERIKNPDRFVLLFAPISRTYDNAPLAPKGSCEIREYKRNKNEYPKTFSESLDYFATWQRIWQGENIAFEYHFWRHQCYYLGGLELSKLLYDDVHLYIDRGFCGIIEDGSQRSFFPNGLAFYTYARAMFDSSLSLGEIEDDYLSFAYGEDHAQFRKYLSEISEVLSYERISQDAVKNKRELYYSPELAEQMERIYPVLDLGGELIRSHYNSCHRVQTVSVRLLEAHGELCRLFADWIIAKRRGDEKEAATAYERLRVGSGRIELNFEKYFDHTLYFNEYSNAQRLMRPDGDAIISLE